MRRLSSATSVGLDHAGTTYHPPLSAPMAGLPAGTRGRSQSVLTHSSAAGLRISMSQAQPGNVLAPYLPSLSRTSSSGAATGTTLASGGYFASRRASVSNTGLAVDPNNTIRIPAIMFQKSNAEEQTKALPAGARASVSPSSSATDALVTPMSAVNEKVAAASEASANDRVSSETLAMRRLQDMIESMRKLSSAKPIAPRDSAVPTPPLSASEPGPVASASKSTTAVDALPDGAETAPPASPAAEPSVAASLSSAAHPTSRFDSILEEDEDSEDDEAKLDADSAANIPGNVSSVPGSPDLASGDVPVTRQSAAAAASAVCAL
ncbi:hypothetical protein GGI23_006316 [Coemansia sp. RSA 2559]|nr:hypothetical protein GGI23_006316 [Coemansia sp. RSA 2559]